MADIWPSTPDTSAADEPNPRVVGLDDEATADLMSALSSDTARDILAKLHEEPTTPSALTDRVDTSLQNVQYHLGNLHDADLVEVIDTVYSEKGREMNVYAPADRPLVMFASPERERPGLKSMLKRLLGGVSLLALASVVVQALLGDLPLPFGTGAGSADGGGPSTMSVESAGAASSATGLPPGLLFFLGGAAVLALGFLVWYVRRSR